MSTESEQSDLGEYAYSREQTGKGTPAAERAKRPQCGYDTVDGSTCSYPAAPGCSRCQHHIDDVEEEQEQDHSHQLAIATASEDDVDASSETRCPECRRPVASMYLVGGEFHQCPECGHRED